MLDPLRFMHDEISIRVAQLVENDLKKIPAKKRSNQGD